jgi:hypothetical protein
LVAASFIVIGDPHGCGDDRGCAGAAKAEPRALAARCIPHIVYGWLVLGVASLWLAMQQ